MNNEEIISFLTKNSNILHIAQVFSNLLREFGFRILKSLADLWNILAGSQSKALDLLDFTSYPKITQFIQDFQPYGIGISAICVIGLGIMVMRNKESDLQKVLQNVLVATVLFVATPIFITNLNLITKSLSNAILDDQNPSMMVFQQNITDLYKLDEEDWKSEWGEVTQIVDAPGHNKDAVVNSNYPNYLGEGNETYKTMNITEVMPVGDWNLFKDSTEFQLSDEAQEALKYKIGYIKGTPRLYKLEDKWFDVDEAYYRYSWHPWIIFFTILAGVIVSIFLIWRLIQLEMELVFSGIWAQLTSFTDLHEGKRNIQLIQTIVNCSVVIVAMFLLQKLNTLSWLFIDALDWNLPLKVIGKLSVSAFIVNGPNVIEKMFGIDAGTRGFMQSLTGMAMGLNSINGLGRSTKGSIRSLGKQGKKLAGSTASGVSRGASSLGGILSGAGNSIFQKGQDMATKSMNNNRNSKADVYNAKTSNDDTNGYENRLSKHTRSNSKNGSRTVNPSIFGNNGRRGVGNNINNAGSVLGNRSGRNALSNRSATNKMNEALNQHSQQSAYSLVSNANRILSSGNQNASKSVFPKANYSSRSMRRNQERLSNALYSKRPFNQSRSQLKNFARLNKDILRNGRR